MFIRALTFGLIAFFAPSGAGEAGQGGMTVITRWDGSPSKGYFEFPHTCKDAKSKGWKEIKNDRMTTMKLLVISNTLGLYYSEDCSTITGIRIAIPCSEKLPKKSGLDYDNFPGLLKYTDDGSCAYVARALFPDALDIDGISFSIVDQFGELRIPNSEYFLARKTYFRKTGCISGIGELWYLTAPKGSGCTKLYPWSVVVQNTGVVGLGFQFFGKTDFGRYQERNSVKLLKDGRKGPGCITKYANDYGLMSLHFWYSGKPANFKCGK